MKDGEVVGIVAEPERLEPPETAHEQPGAGERYDGEGELGRHQPLPDAIVGLPSASRARIETERRGRVGARCGESRRHPEEKERHKRHRRGRCERDPGQADDVHAGKLGRCDGDQQTQQRARGQDAKRAAREREQCALGDYPADEVAGSSAEGSADSDLTTPSGSPDQQEIANVSRALRF